MAWDDGCRGRRHSSRLVGGGRMNSPSHRLNSPEALLDETASRGEPAGAIFGRERGLTDAPFPIVTLTLDHNGLISIQPSATTTKIFDSASPE